MWRAFAMFANAWCRPPKTRRALEQQKRASLSATSLEYYLLEGPGPLVALIQRDRRVHQREAPPGERRGHLGMGRRVFHRHQQFLRLGRQHEIVEQQRGVRMRRAARDAD